MIKSQKEAREILGLPPVKFHKPPMPNKLNELTKKQKKARAKSKTGRKTRKSNNK